MHCQSYEYPEINDTEEDIAIRQRCLKQLDYLADRFNSLIESRLNCILKQTIIDEIKNDLLSLIRDKYARKTQLSDFKQTFDLLNQKCKLFLNKNQIIKQTKQFPLSSSILSGNNFLELLIQDNDSLYILDKHLNIIKYIEWVFKSSTKIVDACWSSILNTFLVLTSSCLYTVNRDEYRLVDIFKRESYRACTCNGLYLYITTGKLIEVFDIFDMKSIRRWNANANDELIEGMCCSYDEQTISLLTYENDSNTQQIEKLIYICHFETMEYLYCLSISAIRFDCLWILIARSIFNEWNILMKSEGKKTIKIQIKSSRNNDRVDFYVDKSMSNDIIHATLMCHDRIAIQTDNNKLHICNISRFEN
jgi:mRNA-degrading endonuclease RelE of RelBE toxin-antitoxin system